MNALYNPGKHMKNNTNGLPHGWKSLVAIDSDPGEGGSHCFLVYLIVLTMMALEIALQNHSFSPIEEEFLKGKYLV